MGLIVFGLNMMRPSLDALESAGDGLAPGLARGSPRAHTPSKMRNGGGADIGRGMPPKPQEQRDMHGDRVEEGAQSTASDLRGLGAAVDLPARTVP